MDIQLISDLHLEFQDVTLPGGDVLVMAGDILVASAWRKAANEGKDTFIADRFTRFITEELSKYRKVVYVAGNHEHYSGRYDETHDLIRQHLPDNCHFLEKEAVQIDDVWFFGGTLWTDCNKGDPITMHTIKDGMMDYRSIKFGDSIQVQTGYGSAYWTNKFTPQFTKSEFHKTVEALKKFLESHPDDKVVVVTHHAPTELSIDPYYKNEYHMNGGYHSRLGNFIIDHPNIKYWFHGHMHSHSEYQMGESWVVTNPRGYAGWEETAEIFDPTFRKITL
mgnify:CR=1 FL=1